MLCFSICWSEGRTRQFCGGFAKSGSGCWSELVSDGSLTLSHPTKSPKTTSTTPGSAHAIFASMQRSEKELLNPVQGFVCFTILRGSNFLIYFYFGSPSIFAPVAGAKLCVNRHNSFSTCKEFGTLSCRSDLEPAREEN